MSEGTFESDGENAEGQEADSLATGTGPTESGGERQKSPGGSTEQGDRGNALDDVDLEPPSS
jgi:hypothetical protein